MSQKSRCCWDAAPTPNEYTGFGMTALMHLGFNAGSNPRVAQVLLEGRADVNAQCHIDQVHVDKWNVLLHTFIGEPKAQWMNMRSATALHYAVLTENCGLIALLVAGRADVELRNRGGKTALELADEFGKSSLMKSLLRRDTAIVQRCLPVS